MVPNPFRVEKGGARRGVGYRGVGCGGAPPANALNRIRAAGTKQGNRVFLIVPLQPDYFLARETGCEPFKDRGSFDDEGGV